MVFSTRQQVAALCCLVFLVDTWVGGSEPYPTPNTVTEFADAVAVGLNLSVVGSQGVAYDLDVGRLALLRYNRIVGNGYQGLSGLYVDQDALVQGTLRVLGPVFLGSSTTVGSQGVAVIGHLNTTGEIWCEGVLRARNSLVVDGDLLVGAGSGDLVVNRLSTTRSSKVRQDATVDGTTHLVGTTTLGSSPYVGVAQNVIPPGSPSTLEIPGVSQFLTGHFGNFSTLKGDWLANGRGSHLTNDLPLRLGIQGQLQGQLLIEAGALAPPDAGPRTESLTPLKGGYDSSIKSATYGKPMVQVGDAYLEPGNVPQLQWVSGVMTYTDGATGVSATTIRGKDSQITVGLDLAVGGYQSTKAACHNASMVGGDCTSLQGHLRLYTGLPINSTVVATVADFEQDAYATISGQRAPTITSPVAVAGSYTLLNKPFKLNPSAPVSDTVVSPVALQVVGNSAFAGFVDIVGSYVNVSTTGVTNVTAQSVSVKTRAAVRVDAGTDVNVKAAGALSAEATGAVTIKAGGSITVKGTTTFEGTVTITGRLTTAGCTGCIFGRRQLAHDANGPSDEDDERILVAASDVTMTYELRGGDGSEPGGIEPVYTTLTRAILIKPATDYPVNKALAVLGASTLDGDVGVTGRLHSVPSSTTPTSDPLVLPIRISRADCQIGGSSTTGSTTMSLPYAGYVAGAVTGFKAVDPAGAPASLYVTKGPAGTNSFVLHCKVPSAPGSSITYTAQLTFYHEMVADVFDGGDAL